MPDGDPNADADPPPVPPRSDALSAETQPDGHAVPPPPPAELVAGSSMSRRLRVRRPPRWWVIGLVLLGMFYVVAVGSAWAFMRYNRGYETVSVFDVAWPPRWSAMRVKQGEHQIARGLEALRDARYPEAFFNLRVGTARAPAHVEGRQALAAIYQAIGQRGNAIDTLAAGLDHVTPSAAYLDGLVTLLLADAQHERVRTLCAALLANPATPPDVRRQAILSTGISLYATGDYAEARRTFEDNNLQNDPVIQEVMAGIDWEQGKRDLAISRLESLREAQPTLDRLYVQLARYYDALDRTSDSERIRLLRRLANPDSVQVAADLVRHLLGQGQRDAARAEFVRAAGRFSTRGSDLEELGQIAASYGLVAWLDDLEQAAAPGTEIERLDLLRLLALTAAGEFRQSLALVADVEAVKPRWLADQEVVVSGAAAVAHFALDENGEGESRLNRTLRAAARSPRALGPLVDLLLGTGSVDAARRLLVGGLDIEPRNATFLGTLLVLDLRDGRTDDLRANLERFLSLPDAGQDVLLETQSALAGDRFIFLADRNALIERARAAAERFAQGPS